MTEYDDFMRETHPPLPRRWRLARAALIVGLGLGLPAAVFALALGLAAHG